MHLLVSFFGGGISGSGKIADLVCGEIVIGMGLGQKKPPSPKGLEEYRQGASTGKLFRREDLGIRKDS